MMIGVQYSEWHSLAYPHEPLLEELGAWRL